MPYLLDTNACIALINGKPRNVRIKFDEALNADESIAVSSIVAHELWYGVVKSARREFNRERLELFLAGPMEFLDFDAGDARAAGELRGALERKGRPIGAFDVLIAGQALNRNLTVVTANHKEFSRISDLLWVDWAAA